MFTYEERSALARRVVMDEVRTLYPSWFYTIDVSPGPVSNLFGMKAWMLLIEEHLKWPSLVPISRVEILIKREELIIEALEMQSFYEDNEETVLENVATKVCFAERQYLVGEQDEESVYNFKILGMMKDLQIDLEKKEELSDKRDLVLRYLQQDQYMVDVIKSMEIGGQKYPRAETITQFSKMKYQDDMFIRSVPGLAKMTKDFLLGRLSYNTMNIISEFLDIRQCLMEYGVTTVLVKDISQDGGNVPVLDGYLIDMLVRNGFFVVDENYKNGRLKKDYVRDKKYGIYKEIAFDVEHIVYVKRKKIHNELCGASYIFEYRGKNMMSIFTRALMYPGIEDEEFGILPSSDPSRGQVICVYPPLRQYEVLELVTRAQDCVEHRYQYFINNKIWPSKDIFAAQCGYNLKIIFPKKSRVLGELYDQYEGKEDMYRHRFNGYLDERYAVDSILKHVYEAKDKVDFFVRLMRNWENPSNYWLGIWIKRYFLLQDVLIIIESKDPKLTKIIWEASRLYYGAGRKKTIRQKVKMHKIAVRDAERIQVRDKFRYLEESLPMDEFPWFEIKNIGLCLL